MLREPVARTGEGVVDHDRLRTLEARTGQHQLPRDPAVSGLPRPLLRVGGQRRGWTDTATGDLDRRDGAVDRELHRALRRLLVSRGDEPQRSGHPGAAVHVVGERACHDRRGIGAHGALGDRLARVLGRGHGERRPGAGELLRERESEGLTADGPVRHRPVGVDTHPVPLRHAATTAHGRHGDRRRIDGRGIVVLRRRSGPRPRESDHGGEHCCRGDDRGRLSAHAGAASSLVQDLPQFLDGPTPPARLLRSCASEGARRVSPPERPRRGRSITRYRRIPHTEPTRNHDGIDDSAAGAEGNWLHRTRPESDSTYRVTQHRKQKSPGRWRDLLRLFRAPPRT